MTVKISDNESLRANQLASIGRVQGAPQPAVSTGTTGTLGTPAAQVNLSSQAQTIAAAMQAVNAVPDTRDELVAKLKAQIEAGTYEVSSADIADQMIRRAKADQVR